MTRENQYKLGKKKKQKHTHKKIGVKHYICLVNESWAPFGVSFSSSNERKLLPLGDKRKMSREKQ